MDVVFHFLLDDLWPINVENILINAEGIFVLLYLYL